MRHAGTFEMSFLTTTLFNCCTLENSGKRSVLWLYKCIYSEGVYKEGDLYMSKAHVVSIPTFSKTQWSLVFPIGDL